MEINKKNWRTWQKHAKSILPGSNLTSHFPSFSTLDHVALAAGTGHVDSQRVKLMEIPHDVMTGQPTTPAPNGPPPQK